MSVNPNEVRPISTNAPGPDPNGRNWFWILVTGAAIYIVARVTLMNIGS